MSLAKMTKKNGLFTTKNLLCGKVGFHKIPHDVYPFFVSLQTRVKVNFDWSSRIRCNLRKNLRTFAIKLVHHPRPQVKTTSRQRQTDKTGHIMGRKISQASLSSRRGTGVWNLPGKGMA